MGSVSHSSLCDLSPQIVLLWAGKAILPALPEEQRRTGLASVHGYLTAFTTNPGCRAALSLSQSLE